MYTYIYNCFKLFYYIYTYFSANYFTFANRFNLARFLMATFATVAWTHFIFAKIIIWVMNSKLIALYTLVEVTYHFIFWVSIIYKFKDPVINGQLILLSPFLLFNLFFIFEVVLNRLNDILDFCKVYRAHLWVIEVVLGVAFRTSPCW